VGELGQAASPKLVAKVEIEEQFQRRPPPGAPHADRVHTCAAHGGEEFSGLGGGMLIRGRN